MINQYELLAATGEMAIATQGTGPERL